MLPFFILAALGYGAASFAYGAGTDEGSSIKQWGRALLAAAALLHRSVTRSSNTKWCISTSIDFWARVISSLINAIGLLLGANATSVLLHAPASFGFRFQIAVKWHAKP
jgi:hypothetical protein